MSDSKFESFKVADKQRPRVKSAAKPAPTPAHGEAQAAQPTLGFDRIEAILDHEDPAQVQKSLSGLCQALDAHAGKGAGQKDKAQAKRAKLAVERTIELLTYLFATKNDMLQAYVASQAGDSKTARPAPRKGGGR